MHTGKVRARKRMVVFYRRVCVCVLVFFFFHLLLRSTHIIIISQLHIGTIKTIQKKCITSLNRFSNNLHSQQRANRVSCSSNKYSDKLLIYAIVQTKYFQFFNWQIFFYFVFVSSFSSSLFIIIYIFAVLFETYKRTNKISINTL